jgi:hypothetical protein
MQLMKILFVKMICDFLSHKLKSQNGVFFLMVVVEENPHFLTKQFLTTCHFQLSYNWGFFIFE